MKESSVANPISTPPAKLDLPVEVIGADVYGRQFLESTRTVTIHRHGVSILLACKLAPDSEVIVRNPETNEEAIATVVGQTPADGAGHVYGLAFLDPSADLWHIQFLASGPARIVHLECRGCHSVCTLSLSDIDLEVFGATRELIRSCKNCNTSGIWKETSLEVRTRKPGNSAGRDLNPKSVASPMEERRRNRRTAMKTSGCIRFSGLEVTVDCEDVSKGGFRYTSRKEYPEGTRIEAAVPYAKFSTNIFSQASIIYCHKMPDGQFRHGVTYTKTRVWAGWDP
jgi:PilZ domain